MPTHLSELVLVENSLDDEILSLRAIKRSGVPFHITVRRDGADALKHLLGTSNPPPALVILDYKLPKLNGLQILARLRVDEKTRLTPVVIFSGTNAGKELDECYKVGANSCVSKPADPKTYLDRLAAVAHYWLMDNHVSMQGPSDLSSLPRLRSAVRETIYMNNGTGATSMASDIL